MEENVSIDSNYYSEIPIEVKQAISKAKSQLDAGEGIPNMQVMDEMKSRFLKNND